MANSNKYMNGYMKVRYELRKQKAITFLGGKCIKCGSKDNLQIDHIDPKNKNFSVSAMWTVKWELYIKELKLCQLLCEPCHREKSALESSVEHGKGLTGKRNCYCNLCKPLKAKYRKENRHRYSS